MAVYSEVFILMRGPLLDMCVQSSEVRCLLLEFGMIHLKELVNQVEALLRLSKSGLMKDAKQLSWMLKEIL